MSQFNWDEETEVAQQGQPAAVKAEDDFELPKQSEEQVKACLLNDPGCEACQ